MKNCPRFGRIKDLQLPILKVNRISEESNKAQLLEVLNFEIILTDALSWETFNFEDRKAKADDIFDYVLTHSDLIVNRQMYS